MHDAVPDEHEQGTGPALPRRRRSPPAIVSGFGVRSASRSRPARSASGSWDIKSNAVTWSGNMEQIHGLAAGSFDGTFAAFQKDIHPEDQPEVMAAIQESVRTGKPYHVHYRLAPQDGERRALGRGHRLRRAGEWRRGADARHLPRRDRPAEAAARIAHARKAAGGRRAARRARADRSRSANAVRRGGGDDRRNSRRRVREDPRTGAGRRGAVAARGRRLARGLDRDRARVDRPPFAGRLRARIGRSRDRHRSQIRDALRRRRRCCATTASTAA